MSGPFVIPNEYKIVSAVYDVIFKNELQKAITIEVEHCVNVTDESTARKLSFAIATIDLTTTEFSFNLVPDGIFPVNATRGSITLNENCILCVLYKGTM